MVYISIPYGPENKRIDKKLVQKEIEILNISDDQKYYVFEAIYNLMPRGVDFEDSDSDATDELQSTLRELGIPYRCLEESDY